MFGGKELSILHLTNSYASELFSESSRKGGIQHGSHGLDHWRRVAGLGRVIAIGEDQNPFLPTLAGLIHDIGRLKTDDPRSGNSQHGILSIEIAGDFLNSLSISQEEKDLVRSAIEDHPFLNERVRKNGLVEVLQDADRCDGLGPITPVKMSQWRPFYPLHPNHVCQETPYEPSENILYNLKFMREWYDMLWTRTAKNLVMDDVTFLDEYIRRYDDQLKRYQQAYTDIWE